MTTAERRRSPDGLNLVLARLASVTSGAETRELDGVAVLRPERDIPADADKCIDAAHRRRRVLRPGPGQ
ncbi:hypothetical protein ACFW5X_02695 [Streptomyces albogriseolus]|uniref:hypothetical protein n=1 Tax=Streptomyces albogriseolus TaxID=1887 RepID=UPI0036989A7C